MDEDQELRIGPKITTNLWSAYGNRPPVLYVKVDGVQIGHWDIGAATAVPEDPEHPQVVGHLVTIESAAQAWQVRQEKRRAKEARATARKEAAASEPMSAAPALTPSPAPAPTAPETSAPSVARGLAAETPAPSPAPPAPPAQRPTTADRGRDLSLNKAGEGARETARAKFREAPVTNLLKRLTGSRNSDDWSWRQGVRGEREVGRALDQAIKRANGWHLLHGIKRNVRGTDVDHLLIGPGGIFSINAKFHEGKNVWVGEHAVGIGRKAMGHLFEARGEAKAVKQSLDAAHPTPHQVTPVVVIAGSSSFSRG